MFGADDNYAVGFIGYLFGRPAVKVSKGLYAMLQPPSGTLYYESYEFREVAVDYILKMCRKAVYDVDKKYLNGFLDDVASSGVGFANTRFVRCT